ncbi:MAG: adenylate/guanylate cyclase domain-containing protein [Pseudomonadota bacterium]
MRPAHRWLLLAAGFAVLACVDSLAFDVGRFADRRAGDVLLALHARQRPASDRVVIVDIDQRSLEQMNDQAGSWPWPRSVHADLIEAIAAQHPRAIVFDILFNELDSYRPDEDRAFADAVARHPDVWLAMTLNADGAGAWISRMPPAVGAIPLRHPPVDARIPLMLPLAVLSQPQAMRGGLINFTPDRDGVGRRYLLYADRSGWRFPSMAARVAGGGPPGQSSILLNWRKGWRHVSYADVYLDALRQRPLRPRNEFTGKIVVIGTSAPGLMDLRVTPLGSTYPGVEILGTALDNLAQGDWLREVPRPWLLPLALAIIAGLGIGFVRNISANRIGYALLGLSVICIAAAWLALQSGVFVPLFAPLAFGWAFYLTASAIAYFTERRARLRTASLFRRFLDPRMVNRLIEHGQVDYRNEAELRDLSVLFSDIRGFTALSERAAPEDVIAMLNGYFAKQVEIIFEHNGTLDKFMGDGIMAFWGAPVANPDSARDAVAAALAMVDGLAALRAELGELGKDLAIGIGIHTGAAVVGFVGSSTRLDYTAIGDTVNLASRVESLTKNVAQILVTQASRDAAGDAFGWRDHGIHAVKGRDSGVRLFEPLRRSDASGET